MWPQRTELVPHYTTGSCTVGVYLLFPAVEFQSRPENIEFVALPSLLGMPSKLGATTNSLPTPIPVSTSV
jgi:hypothetical protein